MRPLVAGQRLHMSKMAQQGGMSLMREDGERLVQMGITSREELVRVTRD